MLDDFLVRAAFAGLGVALATAPLGCFVVWRRMAYFGDATAHPALLGVALALALDGPVMVGVLAVALFIALAVSTFSERGLAEDSLLGVLAHSMLAIGLLSVSLLNGVRVNLTAYLVGNILAVSKQDLALIWGGGFIIVALIVWRWQALLTSTLSPNLAQASGINARREQFVLTIALAIVVAVAIKVVDALLISALLIIPAAAARPLAKTPEAMAIAAAIIGSLAALGGLGLAFELDTQTGPTIITIAAATFFMTNVVLRMFVRKT